MGNDAVILSTEEQSGINPFVEITAAVDYDLGGETPPPKAGTEAADKIGYAPEARPPRGDGEGAMKPGGADDRAYIGELKRDVSMLREMIEDMKEKGYEMALPGGKAEVMGFLKKRAIREDLAWKLCRRTEGLEDLLKSISEDMATYGGANNKKVVIVVGPTGVGKTTTIAKLSARAVKNNKRVAMINLDTYRIGAIEQIRIYARIMGIPLDIASGTEELRTALSKHSEKDIVFIDTTGRNPRDDAYIDELLRVYDLGFPVETHVLMSASSDDEFMVESHRHYRRLPIDCIGVTKLDEAVRLGSIYNLSSLYEKPVAYVTTGQKVPQDIDFPNSERLADMILNNGVVQ
jgi:flagellar biosynthesis protein FlhF